MHNKVHCKAITKIKRKHCERWAVVNGYCEFHVIKSQRVKKLK